MTSKASTSIVALLSVSLTACVSQTGHSSTHSEAQAPSDGARSLDADTAVQWFNVDGPESSTLRIAVARPTGSGPFPAVIILHGTHGFAREYVQLAHDLATLGIVGVAACWFSGRRGAGIQFITPLECPKAPPLPDDSEPNRFRVAGASIAALLQVVRSVPGVRADNVALLGHSRGGGAVLNYALADTGTIAALILNSTGYPAEVISRASMLRVPVLIMHGVADAPADGGSPRTAIAQARAFEAALRGFQKHVEVKYYEGGSHNEIFQNRVQYRDQVQRIAAFILAQSRQKATRSN
jgi:dienelactone hydrolase